jgi:hypothetical protein
LNFGEKEKKKPKKKQLSVGLYAKAAGLYNKGNHSSGSIWQHSSRAERAQHQLWILMHHLALQRK